MENLQNDALQQNESDKKNHLLTPHQLVEQHMQHPDEPITEADINNLNLDVNTEGTTNDNSRLTSEEKRNADELADAIESDDTGMAYKADV